MMMEIVSSDEFGLEIDLDEGNTYKNQFVVGTRRGRCPESSWWNRQGRKLSALAGAEPQGQRSTRALHCP